MKIPRLGGMKPPTGVAIRPRNLHDDRDSSNSTYFAQKHLHKMVAKLPPEEQEKYWNDRTRRLQLGQDSLRFQRKKHSVTLPKINLPE